MRTVLRSRCRYRTRLLMSRGQMVHADTVLLMRLCMDVDVGIVQVCSRHGLRWRLFLKLRRARPSWRPLMLLCPKLSGHALNRLNESMCGVHVCVCTRHVLTLCICSAGVHDSTHGGVHVAVGHESHRSLVAAAVS